MSSKVNQDFALSIGRLQVALGRLRSFQPKFLNAEQNRQRTATMKSLRKLIEDLTKQELRRVSEEMAGNTAKLNAATAQLQEDLAHLQSVTDVIKVIAAGIGLITSILMLMSPVKVPG